MNVTSSVGEKIREARIENGWSQRTLAGLVGCSPPSVLRWERNYSRPLPIYARTLERLLRIEIVPKGEKEPVDPRTSTDPNTHGSVEFIYAGSTSQGNLGRRGRLMP